MKKLICLIYLSVLATSSFAAIEVRWFALTNDTSQAYPRNTSNFRFYQGEQVYYDLYPTVYGGGAYSLTQENAYVCWYLTSLTNKQTIYIAVTGTIVTATNGHCQFSVGTPTTAIKNGKYDSFVKAYQPVDGTNAFLATLAQNYFTVLDSPDVEVAILVPPVYALTGTPVYVEVDPESLHLTGGTMTGAFTNQAGAYLNGVGVTNLDLSEYTSTELNDISSAGSGIIITESERNTINFNAANNVLTSNQIALVEGAELWSGYAATQNVDLAGNTISNGLFAGDGYGLTNLTGSIDTKDTAVDQAYLMYSTASNGYVHQYGPRATWQTAQFIAAQLAGTSIFPGQLYRFTFNNKVYECTNTIATPPFTTTNYPTPLDSDYWRVFVEDGDDGATGATGLIGTDGQNGLGNVLYSSWNSLDVYLYDTSALPIVGHSGQWYESVASSTNKNPTGVGATNYWALTIMKGSDGTITTVSNLVERGAWDSGAQYTNLDVVAYLGNTFYVGETNQVPGRGVAPPTSLYIGYDNAYWIVKAAKGAKGATGLTGDDGAITTNILNITYNILLDTNVYEWTNDGDSTNRVPTFASSTGGTNFYTWVPDSDIAAESWSGYAATQVVDIAGNIVTGAIYYGDGQYLTNLPVGGSAWSGYAATQNVDLAGNTISNGSFSGDGSSLTNLPDSGATNLAYGGATSYADQTITMNTNEVIGGIWPAIAALDAGSATNATLLNGILGPASIVPGANITVTVAGTNLTISSSVAFYPSETNDIVGVWTLDVRTNTYQKAQMTSNVTSWAITVTDTNAFVPFRVDIYGADTNTLTINTDWTVFGDAGSTWTNPFMSILGSTLRGEVSVGKELYY